MLRIIKKIIPKPIFNFFQPAYHYSLALLGAIVYRFPSRKIKVVGVTGTKGKSTTIEFVNSIFEAAGYKTALLSTIHFKIGEKDRRNMYKMTMPGRFFVQKFLREAVSGGCGIAILEMTSEGAKQYRNKFIELDALIFTNLSPEHIESHGSYDNYVAAKVSIAKELETSSKNNPTLVVNADDKEREKFLSLNIKNKIKYSLKDAGGIEAGSDDSSFSIDGLKIKLNVGGIFNVSNALGAIALAKSFDIEIENIKAGLENTKKVRGRMEKITLDGSDPQAGGFDLVVDYAHTPDSLRAVYKAYEGKYKICVLGNTGGGRDKWKRPEMGRIADDYCDQIILTNEDPYDEDPLSIIEEMKKGIRKREVEVIMDRREAIRIAISKAKSGSAVLITGKGTDPYIMGKNGERTPWDDAEVAREELKKYAGTS